MERISLKKKIVGLLFLLNYYLFGVSRRYYYWVHKKSRKQILDIIDKNKYDIIQIEHWYQAVIFKNLKNKVLKVIDTHDVLFEKKALSFKAKYKNKIPFFKKRELNKYKNMEIESLNNSDQLISISSYDYKRLNQLPNGKKNILIPTGQPIKYYQEYKIEQKPEDAILFYGGMSSEQNVKAFFRFWKYIFPQVKKEIKNIKLYVVGSNPPQIIKSLHNGESVIITGFVDDVRPYFNKSKVMVLPLDIAGGFRSRVIDVMAMGIPVVGTHNALDSIEMTNDEHGFICDNNNDISKYLVKILSDEKLHYRLSTNCVEFVTQKYSIKATYGKLSQYYSEVI